MTLKNIVTDTISAMAIGVGVGGMIGAAVTGHHHPFIFGLLMLIGAVTLKHVAKE